MFTTVTSMLANREPQFLLDQQQKSMQALLYAVQSLYTVTAISIYGFRILKKTVNTVLHVHRT